MCLSVCFMDHYFFVTCCLSIVSVVVGVSDLHQSNVDSSYGLFQIRKLTNHILLPQGKEKIWTVPHPNHKVEKAEWLRNMTCCALWILFHRNVEYRSSFNCD